MDKKALIIIDVQNCFVNEQTKSLSQEIISYIENNRPDFVLFTKFINSKDSNFYKILGYKECLSAPGTDIHKDLTKFVNKKNVFERTSYSVFKSDEFMQFLKENKIKKLLLCGIDIDACVLASAFEGFDLGYEVEILKELSLSQAGKEFDDAAIKIIERNLEKNNL